MGLRGLIYLDPSVVIEVTEPSSLLYPKIAPPSMALPLDEICVSELVRLECLVRPTRAEDAFRISLIESFLGRFVDLPVDRAVYDLAVRLRADRRRLKTPDALHLALALHHGCAEFWTNDRDLTRLRVGLTFRTL